MEPGPTPTLTPSAPGLDERLGTGPAGDVPADDLDVQVGLELRDHVQHGLRVAVRRVHHQEVGPGLGQCLGPALGVLAHADRGPDDQPSRAVLGRVRELLALGEVLDRDQPAQPAAVVDQRQLLHLVLLEQRERRVPGDPDRRGDQRHRGHDRGHPAAVVGDEPDVPVGHDADQHAVRAGHRDAGDAVPGAQLVDFGHRGVRAAGHRVGDHAGLGPLDRVHLLRLLVHREVAVQHADPADAGHRDGHPGLGHRVHGRRDQRHVQRDPAGQPGGGVRLAGHHHRMRRQQQDVVEGQGRRGELSDVAHGTFRRAGSGIHPV